ncbi:MAG: 2-oxo acid dehydrogenase subunit E2 [Phototrophicales bacterium]|nr:MAG: 2-oxo acid dehydrogenase subunit E2 [Phototrophicales bacterium]
MNDVLMPQLGESVVEGTISRWLKRVGDPVRAFEPLLEVSTDKVDTEIPAPADGVLLEILVEAGKTVAKGTRLAVIGAVGESPAPTHESADSSDSAPHITPVVARMAAEYQIDLAQIAGTGRGGRVTKKDVEAYLARRQSSTPLSAAPWDIPGSGDLFSAKESAPKVTSAVSPPAAPRLHPVEPLPPQTAGELIPHSPIRRQIAEHMVLSARTSPHVTTVFEVDMSAVMAHREAHKAEFAAQGVNLTLTAYFVLAAVAGLRAAPMLNARWTDEGVFVHRVYHIGMAVAIPDGLIVPVIKNAGDLSLLGAARAVNDLAARARDKQLKPDEVRDGTFTITNHGVAGSLFATPLIHQPQVGILGVGVIEKRVKVVTDAFGGDTLAIRPCCYLSLSFDHRVADGAAGDGFLLTVKRTLESWT